MALDPLFEYVVRRAEWCAARSARFTALPLLFIGVHATPARGQWAFEAFLGSAASAPSTLTVYQDGQPPISFMAHYATRPTEPSIYYATRLSRWWGQWGGFIGFLHHKLYLTNPTPEVEEFRVTYGYNLTNIGAGYLVDGWTLFGGVGPVVTNPASVVRGQRYVHTGGIFDTGYYISGANVQVGVNRRFYVVGVGFLTADARLSAAWASVPVADGTADTPNYAAHLLVGIGVGKRREEGAP